MKVVDKGKPQRVSSLTIEFTEDELDTLVAICTSVGGCPTKSPRKHVDKLGEILSSAGYECYESNSYKLGTGDIYFKDYPNG